MTMAATELERIARIEAMVTQWEKYQIDVLSEVTHDIEETGIYAFSNGFLLGKLGLANARKNLVRDMHFIFARYRSGEKSSTQTLDRIIERTRLSLSNPHHGNPYAQAVANDQAEATREILYIALGLEEY